MNRSMIVVAAVALGFLAQAAIADWPVFGHDGNNSGITSEATAAHNLSAQWSVSLYQDYGLKFQPAAAPVISNGSVYAYALSDSDPATYSNKAYLVSLNAKTGAVQWVSDRLQDEGGYGSHNGASVDTATGDVYVASWNSMYRINGTNGQIVWQHTTPGSFGANAVVNGAPALGAGKAFWQTANGAGHLVSIDMNSTGVVTTPAMNVAMDSAVGGSSVGTPVVFSKDDQTYVTMNYSHGYGFPMGGGIEVMNVNTGEVVWSHTQAELPADATNSQKAAYGFNSSVSYKDGVLYARSYDDRMGQTFNGTLTAYDAMTGSVIWSTTNRVAGGTNDNAVNGHGAPIVDDKYVYVGGGTALYGGLGQKVQAYDRATGQPVWQTAGIGGWGNQMALSGGYLYVGTEGYTIYDADWNATPAGGDKLSVLSAATGQIVAQYNGAGTSPALAYGMIYTIDGQGNMVAIKGSIPGDADNSGLVDQDDYKVWYDNYGTGTTWEQGNFKGYGMTDQDDYKTWYDNYGGKSAMTPEPATLALLVLGAAAALKRRR